MNFNSGFWLRSNIKKFYLIEWTRIKQKRFKCSMNVFDI